MSKGKEIGIDFSKKKITNQNLMSKIVKYCQNQKILANEIKHFVFSNNDLSDLCSLDMFSNLQKLDLSNNNFNVVPTNISSLMNLKHLNLSNNKIEMGENYIVPLTNLTYLDLSFNQFEDFHEEYYYEEDEYNSEYTNENDDEDEYNQIQIPIQYNQIQQPSIQYNFKGSVFEGKIIYEETKDEYLFQLYFFEYLSYQIEIVV